ncbi:MAG: hypothetical protein JSU63_07780 [Phycisphaerales bacterium]|nr:MAG: hypothetical protein JSU63_07780 [Phycisphaerales bacterium]
MAGCGGEFAGPGDLDEYRDEVLDRYFTEDAARILRYVPLSEGTVNVAAGFSVGPDWGSRLASAVFGNGGERQVLIVETVGELVVFHEYIHQADYFGLIDRELFASRYEQLLAGVGYRAIAEDAEATIIELHSGDFLSQLALAYNDGLTRELIAYLIAGYVRGDYDLPEYFLEVYESVVRIPVSYDEVLDEIL